MDEEISTEANLLAVGSVSSDDALGELIIKLEDRLKRVPTEDEVYNFIFGDEVTRILIWNSSNLKKE